MSDGIEPRAPIMMGTVLEDMFHILLIIMIYAGSYKRQ